MVVLFISDWETRVVRTYTTGWFNKNGTLATMLLVVRGDIKSSWNKEPDTSFWCEPSDMVTVQRHIFLSLICPHSTDQNYNEKSASRNGLHTIIHLNVWKIFPVLMSYKL